MNREVFEQYIHEAILAVPEQIRRRIENVAFVVEDDARPARMKERQIKARGVLLGLYEGIPLHKRSAGYSGVLPDKITIFKHVIEHLAGPYPENVRKLVHEVVHHEIAHYFGFDEGKVRAWEKKRRKTGQD